MKDVKDAPEMARVKGFEIQFHILFMKSSQKTGVKKKLPKNGVKCYCQIVEILIKLPY